MDGQICHIIRRETLNLKPHRCVRGNFPEEFPDSWQRYISKLPNSRWLNGQERVLFLDLIHLACHILLGCNKTQYLSKYVISAF